MMGQGFGDGLYGSLISFIIVVAAVSIGVGYAIAKLLPHIHLSFHWS